MAVQQFPLQDFELESGAVLPDATLAYATYGELDAGRQNAIVFPTWFAGTHESNEWLIGPGRPLDTDRYFVIVPNTFGNGLSSSPSNAAPPFDGTRFPAITVRDNVEAQYRLVSECFDIQELALVLGCSMAAMQTYQWAVDHPEMVRRALPYCGAPRTPAHGQLFVDSLRAALTGSVPRGSALVPQHAALETFARVFAAWGFSQAFHRQEEYRSLGFDSVEATTSDFWIANFAGLDRDNALCQLDTWFTCDVSRGDRFEGNLSAALGSVKAQLVSLACDTDLYFPPEDEAAATAHIPDGLAMTIHSVWGHQAGGGTDPVGAQVIGEQVRRLLDSPA
ncbi:homoserine O-acetyltransferase [Nocardia neocaledoniensis NBRC 108232]|uniref:Homoserine O-acetyltransferase n=1 Tax=Nocardia neocaledoniensis TaxID=236511 RepID=A0A317NH33_9NOCA|nr:alpha/beta fold hydrolase [Nocardia neocaledoniensis]PWV74499.1 homoserine O-acetyltransferase [Nocardia neocaledoniensis]GEM28998.1 homoserine O-acetyltransferase [Nocardia neocaledoniensis NBRC 108232]